MNKSETYPLTLLYDGRCAVCALEMDRLRLRSTRGSLVFVDIADDGFDPAPYGVTHAALDAEIRARRADGRLIRGLEALRLAYAAVGLGLWLAPTAWPALRPLADLGYRVFARHRHAISAAARPLIDALRHARAQRTARRLRACQSGHCDIEGRRP